nr:MAG TPA: Cytosine specific methyltransferase [Caudoviricetes sp.]
MIKRKDHRFPYLWEMKDTKFLKNKGKVMSCFCCVGGGSSFGYALAGYDVIACNEIDTRVMKMYLKNHSVKYSFNCDIRDLSEIIDKGDSTLKDELYNLDILDASFPCSTFSIAGDREKAWGKKKKFREGQKAQVLDDLAFYSIALAKKLQPKVVVFENVKGLLIGKAIEYVREIYKQMDEAGYILQHWLLNAKNMGVPQKRERVFFIGLRKDLCDKFLYNKDLFTRVPYIDMSFNETEILLEEFADYNGRVIPQGVLKYWKERTEKDKSIGDIVMRKDNRLSMFNNMLLRKDDVCNTISAMEDRLIYYDYPKYMSAHDTILASSFPIDYNFDGMKPWFACGMCVPPVMMANVAERIWEHWLSKLI